MTEPREPSRKPPKGPWYSTGNSVSATVGLLVLWTLFLVTQVGQVWARSGLAWWNVLAIASSTFLIVLFGINLVRLLRARVRPKEPPAPHP